MTDAFISYSRKDKAFVERLFGALASHGRKAWVDWEGIPPSAEWMNEIHQAIDAAQSFIFVVSPNSAASKVCAAELDHALANNKRIIPILRGEVVEPALPKSVRDRNWIWCRDEDLFEPAVAAVISSMDTDLDWVRSHTRLLGRAHEWETRKRNVGYALHGADLRAAEDSVAGAQGMEPALSRLQIEYILASRRAQDRRRRRLTMGVIVAAATIAVLGILYWATERESRHNLARDFHDAALSALVDRKFGLAEVLLARGLEIDDSRDTRQRLLEARARTAKLVWMSPAPMPRATIAAISPGGRHFAEQIGGKIAIWKVGSSQAEWSVNVGEGAGGTVAISDDGRELAIGRADDIALWDLASESPDPVRRLHLDPGVGVARLIFSAGRRLLAVATRDKRVLVFDLTRPGDMPRYRFRGHTDKVDAIALDPAGLVSGSWDNSVKEWQLDKPDEPKATLQGHIDAVLCVAISPDGQLVASGGWDNTILVWDRATGKQLRALNGHQGGVLALAFSADGAWLVSGSEDATARLWEVASGRHVLTLVGHSADVRSVAFAGPAGERIVTGDADGHLRVWDRGGIGQRAELSTLRGHQGPVSSIAFSGAAPTVASGSWDRTIRIWDLGDGHTVRTLTGHTDAVTSVRFSPDGRTLASAGKDSTVRLWDLGSGRATVLHQGETGRSTKVRDVAFSADGSRIATAGDDGTIRFWGVADQRMVASIPSAHARTINSLAGHPNSTQLASGSDDGTIALWDVKGLRKIGTVLDVPGNDKAVWQIAFTPDGTTLVSGGDDRELHVWDIDAHAERGAPLPHQGSVWSVDIAPDGLHVATGASDSTVHLFSTGGTGSAFALREDLVVRVADGPVWWVAFDHDRKSLLRLAIGSTDKTVRILDIRRLEALFSDPHSLEHEAEIENGLQIVSDDPQTGVVPLSNVAFPLFVEAP